MKKLFFTFALFFTASIIFLSCSRDSDYNGNGNENGNGNPSGIGEPTATTDPGVVINGTRWATRNVAAPGAFAQHAHDAGMFFQWNRRIGWSTTDPMVSSPAGATWSNTHVTDETWVRTNDPCPLGWRMPTLQELQSLGVGNTWVTNWNDTGVNGSLFGTAPNLLFLPAAGARLTNGALAYVGNWGHVWSSTQGSSMATAWGLLFGGGTTLVSGDSARALGLSVRCVAE